MTVWSKHCEGCKAEECDGTGSAGEMVQEFHLKYGAFVYPPGRLLRLAPEPMTLSVIRIFAASLRELKKRVVDTHVALSSNSDNHDKLRDGDIVPFLTKLLRVRLMIEELSETIDAIAEGDVVEVADGLADLKYVVEGTAVSFGIPLDLVFAEVHRSNMSKTPLDTSGKGGKVEKGGYSPPEIRRLLNLQENE